MITLYLNLWYLLFPPPDPTPEIKIPISWSGTPSTRAEFLLGGRAFPINARAGQIETITVAESWAAMPLAVDADILDITVQKDSVRVTVQSDKGTELVLFGKNGERVRCKTRPGGVREIIHKLPRTSCCP